jgi:hypothetical protein
MDIKELAGDGNKKADGVWLKWPPDMEFRLGYLQGKEYQHYVQNRMMRARRGRSDFPADKSDAIMVEALVKFIVKDWKGVTKNGEEYPCNPVNATWMLDNIPDFKNWVIEQANDIENFGGKSADGDVEEDTPAGDLKSGPEVAASVGAGIRLAS